MKISNPKKLNQKDVIIFDLDGTIAPSKSSMDAEMAKLIIRLLEVKHVAVISGGEMSQFKLQLLNSLKGKKVNYKNLHLFPTNSSAFYRYKGGKWTKVYAHMLTKSELAKIMKAFNTAFHKTNYQHPKKIYGQLIQNRGTQVSFSALGQKVVAVLGKKGVTLKEEWAKKYDVRPQLLKVMKPMLPGLEVRIGGLTTIDVTRKGIDKAYGVRQIRDHLKVPITRMLFVGDKMMPGGNDYAALKTGIEYVAVKDPEETKKVIRKLL